MEENKLLYSLQKLVDQLLLVPYHQQRLRSDGVFSGKDIKNLEDFARLPLTWKEDLRKNYPFGLLAVPGEQVVRFHASSGTTGKPTVVAYTKNDITLWGNILARDLRRLGVTEKDIVQNAMGYGLFTGGLGWHYGIETLGAAVVPTSGGNTRRQIKIMQDFGTTVLLCTPSYALHIAEMITELGVDRDELSLRILITGAEPCSDIIRSQLEKRLGVKAYDSYGLSEVIGPGVAIECPCQHGLHIDEHFYPEIIDTNENILPLGEKGELVLSSFGKEAFPVLRYRTKDYTRLSYGKCSCGHEGFTMEKVSSRLDDMLIIHGVNVFPSQIEEVLLSFIELEPQYQLIITRKEGLSEQLEIQVELSRENSSQLTENNRIADKVKQQVKSVLGINVKVTILAHQTLPRSSGKAQRVIYR